MARTAWQHSTLKPEFSAQIQATRALMDRIGVLRPLQRELAKPAGASPHLIMALIGAAFAAAETEASDAR